MVPNPNLNPFHRKCEYFSVNTPQKIMVRARRVIRAIRVRAIRVRAIRVINPNSRNLPSLGL